MDAAPTLSRRSALRLLTTLAVGNVVPRLATAASRSDGLDQFGAVMASHDYTLICEPAHQNGIKTLDLIGSAGFLDHAKAAGVGTIGLELPTEWQIKVDRLRFDKTYRSDFLETMEDFAPNFLKMAEIEPFRVKLAGIVENSSEWGKIVFYDNSTTEPAFKKFMDFIEDRLREVVMDDTITDKQAWKKSVEFGKKHKAEINSLMHDVVVDRITPAENQLLLDNLDGNAQEGRRLIVVGVEHAPAMKKLLEEQGKTVGVVVLYPSRHEHAKIVKDFKHSDFPLDLTIYDQFIIDRKIFVEASHPPVRTIADPRPVNMSTRP